MSRTNGKKYSIDFILLGILVALAIISVVAIYLSEPIMSAYLRDSDLWMKQIQWFLIGAAFCIVLIYFGIDRTFTGVKIFYWVLNGLLFLLLIDKFLIDLPLIRPVNGTTAWYQIPYIGSFQPSEFMKIVLIIFCANIIHEHNENKQELSYQSDLELFYKILKFAALPLVLILLQPDTGIPIIVVISIAVMLCISGIKSQWIIYGGLTLFIVLSGFLILYELNPNLLNQIFGGGYRLTRIYGWLDVELYSSSWGHQLYTSLMTVGASGLNGISLNEAIIYFPEPQTDFIFTVIAQNFGLMGTSLVIFLCLALDLKLLHIAFNHHSNRERLLLCGAVGMLMYQQFQNMGMIVGILPITGITLPFISYGGSSMISYMIPLAIAFTMSSDNLQKHKH